jgi:hypothetical protein
MNYDNGPGYDTTNEILTKMRLGVEFRWPIRIRDFEVMVRPLSMAETVQVMSNVAVEMKRSPDIFKNRIYEHALIAKEHLILATTSRPGAGDYRLTHPVLNDFTPDEIIAIYKEYVTVTEKCDPAVETMKPEDLKKLVSDLKKTSLEELDSQLTALSFWQIKAVAFYLINCD